MTPRNRHIAAAALRHGVFVGLGALLLALPVGLFSQTVLKELPYLYISVPVLLVVIGVGIVFDVVGVAVTAAREAPLHARASRQLFGARRAVRLVRNAHQVASFCNDVVGDVSGTLSGAIGVSIVYQVLATSEGLGSVAMNTVMSAAVAGLIVGGKAYGKVYALRSSTEIVFQVGRLLELLAMLAFWRRGD